MDIEFELPDGYVLAPHFRGYALLGAGAYMINTAVTDGVPELVISIASDEEKIGREVGDLQENTHGKVIEPEAIAVRIAFKTERGLFALERQLKIIREEYFKEEVWQVAPQAER